MTQRNFALKTVRISLNMTQKDFARAIQEAGQLSGEPNDATPRLVQRWESGAIRSPQRVYRTALRAVTGRPIEDLGFSPMAFARIGDTDGEGGEEEGDSIPVLPLGVSSSALLEGGLYTGIWLSRYRYFSSGRDTELTGLHYVMLLHHGNRMTVNSLPDASSNPRSPLSMDLKVEHHVVTGTWREQTAQDGYYRGAVYHGAIQMLVEPTGRRMDGRWVGFGKDFEVNSGPWELTFQTADVSKNSLKRYNRSPQ